jgi:hypothetical protein
MPLPRAERLRIIQEVYVQWQELYGDREDLEAEAANYAMISEALEKAEANWNAQQA